MAKKKSKVNIIIGTDENELLNGTAKADKIYTKNGVDTVVGGKGNDTIIVDGTGNKNIQINQGDGNDTIITTGVSSSSTINVNLQNPTSFKRDGLDLIISNDSESVRLKNYDNILSGILNNDDYNHFQLNGLSLDNMYSYSPFKVDVKSTKGSAIINQVADLVGGKKALNSMLKMVGVKIPKWVKDINVFFGTNYDDTMVGHSKGIDGMISEGGNNTFTTGKNAKSVIVSASENSDDKYTVSNFTVGTIIIDQGSKTNSERVDEVETGDTLIIKNVDTNDIHMATIDDSSMFSSGISLASTLSDYSVSQMYLTDTKGVKNLAGINYSGIYKTVANKINTIKTQLSQNKELKAYKTIGSLANYALKNVSSIINKFRGVFISVEDNTKYTLSSGLGSGMTSIIDSVETKYKTMLDKDIIIYDKKGNRQYISVDAIKTYNKHVDESTKTYVDGIVAKYGLDSKYTDSNSSIVNKASADTKNLMRFILYIADGLNTNGLTKKQKKAAIAEYNKVKANFFNIYKNAFIGTTGNNSYTITKDNANGIYVSDSGSDIFTFKGTLSGKNTTNNYKIISNLDTVVGDNLRYAGVRDTDNIIVKNYSFDNYSLLPTETKFVYDIEGADEFAIGLRAANYKNNSFSNIDYLYDYRSDDTSGFIADQFNIEKGAITIEDSTKTKYSVSVITNNGENNGLIQKDWTNSDLNNFAIYNAESLDVKSNNKKNVILFNSKTDGIEREDGDLGFGLIPERASLKYTYDGGSDIVYSSNSYSDDIYNVAFNNKTKLLINDIGTEDYDTLELSGDSKVSDMRLFFNVGSDGSVIGNVNIVSKGNMKKGNFILAAADGTKNIYTNKGISFTYNSNPNVNGRGIEEVRNENGQELILSGEDGAVNMIAENVASWLGSHTKYADAYDVLAKGTKKDVASLLAIYNKTEIQMENLAI